MTIAGPLCQIEIQVADLAKSLSFYEAVFGWRKSAADIHDYHVLDVPDEQSFGVALIPIVRSDPTKTKLTLYFRADDPAALLAVAEAAGGKKLSGPTRAMGYGDVYFFEDPNGVKFGLFKPDTRNVTVNKEDFA